ncbi:UDP-GalNAc:beta-1,3-N-acetylgalactosaminyltransferase 1-like [Babylonia areolata]|uniref:UDP-GalNAc:beta-1, 3-N-acetylgalactosaminyltransferase 1-like n=1 Tax=Babylonia areolata TaxID=304850 RepID=UPI003FCFE3BA
MASARLQLKRLFSLVTAVYGLTLLLIVIFLHRYHHSFVHRHDTFPNPMKIIHSILPALTLAPKDITANRSSVHSAPKISPAVTKTKELSTFCPMRLTAKDHVTPEEYFRPRPDPVTDVVSTFLIQPSSQFCGSFLDILFLVPSSPFGEKDRSAIRDTWGSGRWPHQPHGIHMAVLFLLARPPEKNRSHVLVEKEAAAHGDVLMLDAEDGYRQMTVKMLAGLQWLSQHCRLVRYVARVDADHFLNVPLFYHRVHSWFQHSPQRHHAIMGKVLCSVTSVTHRTPLSKHFVNFTDYPFDYLPTYMAGGTYVMTAELVPRLVNVSRYVKSFTVDDAYITGVLARTLNLLLVNLQHVVFENSADHFFKLCGLSFHIKNQLMSLQTLWEKLHTHPGLCTQRTHFPMRTCAEVCGTRDYKRKA